MKKSKFQFSNPCLLNLTFEINDNFDSTVYEMIKMDGRTKILKSKKNNLAVVKFSLTVGDRSVDSPFYICASMKADFEWGDELDEGTVDTLLRANAPSLILGYLRPIIANVTNMSEYPVLNIPFMDMQENKAEIEEYEA